MLQFLLWKAHSENIHMLQFLLWKSHSKNASNRAKHKNFHFFPPEPRIIINGSACEVKNRYSLGTWTSTFSEAFRTVGRSITISKTKITPITCTSWVLYVVFIKSPYKSLVFNRNFYRSAVVSSEFIIFCLFVCVCFIGWIDHWLRSSHVTLDLRPIMISWKHISASRIPPSRFCLIFIKKWPYYLRKMRMRAWDPSWLLAFSLGFYLFSVCVPGFRKATSKKLSTVFAPKI